jgi:cyclic pyranopterin phosphate synthase
VPKLSHYDEDGSVRMVDVGDKVATKRTARAHAFVKMSERVLRQLPQNPKGNPLEIARIAGIQGAKKTSELIPLCHPLALTKRTLDRADGVGVRLFPRRRDIPDRRGDGGLTAAAVAALTIYDMCRRWINRSRSYDLLLENHGKPLLP